jgi:outer membrane protein TolC
VKKLFVVAVLNLIASGVASAQSVPLTLDDAIARTLKESSRVAELRARVEGARAAADAAVASSKPQLSLQGGYTRTNHVDVFGIPLPDGTLRVVYPDVPDNYRARVDGIWVLYSGGRSESLTAAARAEVEAAAKELAALEADLRLDVTRAYWASVTASESARVVEQTLAQTDAHLKDLQARLEQGLIPPNEVLTAEAHRSRQRVQVIEARNASEVALAELRRLARLEPSAMVDLTTPLSVAGTSAAGDLETQIARAKASRPERGVLLQRIDAAAARVAAAGAGSRPAILLNGGVDYGRPNVRIFPRADRWKESWDVSINASWSLWDGGRRAADVAAAAAAERALRSRLDEFDSLVALEIRQRRLELDAGLASAGAAADGIRSAVEARRVVGERFAAGVATSTDVLDAQLDILHAELDRTRALAAVRLAEARLARALGSGR